MNRTPWCVWAGLLLASLAGHVSAQSGYGQPAGSSAPRYAPYAQPHGVMPVQAMQAGYPMQPRLANPIVQQVYVPVTVGEGPLVRQAEMPAGPPVAVAWPARQAAGSCSSGNCGSGAVAGCSSACAARCSAWYVSAEALWLERSRSQRVFLGEEQVIGTPTIAGVLDTEAADFNPEPGIRVLLGYRLTDALSAELSYFGVHDGNTSATLPLTNPALNGLVSNFLALATGADALSFSYSSELHNAELALRSLTESDRLSLSILGGLRYVNLHEDCALGAVSAAFGASEETSATTNNHLVGLQFGGEAAYRLGERWSIGAVGKGGLYLNIADQRVRNVTSTAGVSTSVLDTTTSGNHLAGGFETGVVVRCRLSDSFTLRGGYQVLYLTGLALAPEQFTSLNNDLAKFPQTITPGVTGAFLNDRGSLLFHGPSVGFEVAW
jgi:hypothetical protein